MANGKGMMWGTLDPFFEEGPALGRRAANQGFLRALLRRDPFGGYHFFLDGPANRQLVEARLREEHPALWDAGSLFVRDGHELPRALANEEFHAFHLANCLSFPPHLARLRNLHASRIFPITGVTHTLSHAHDTARFLAQMWSGVTERDAVVATSRTARVVVERTFELLRARYRLDAELFPAPRVERIPLGVEPDELAPLASDARDAARGRIGVGPGDVALLIFARISPHSKMDLLPVFAALDRAFAGGLDRASVRLIVAGALAPGDPMPDLLEQLAGIHGVELRIVANPDDEQRRALYGAADIFLSPVDNVQETFGLTVLEAGAMELPAVVSDYDGYRDLVVDGDTGFLVPTVGPADTGLTDAAARLATDPWYHLVIAQQTVVDVPALADRIATLARSAERRHAMGRRARERVRELFSWDRVIDDYLALWQSLGERPVDREGLRRREHPLHLPVTQLFAGYPTRAIAPEDLLVATPRGLALLSGGQVPLRYAPLHAAFDDALVAELVERTREPVAAADLLAWMASSRGRTGEAAWQPILWALKHDYLVFCPSGGED